jgi:hypothetical protein
MATCMEGSAGVRNDGVEALGRTRWWHRIRGGQQRRMILEFFGKKFWQPNGLSENLW